MLRSSPVCKSTARSWVQTLRLPKSDFPARPDSGLRSHLLQSCTNDLYTWQSSARPATNSFVLHDGPPYANGDLHVGHALNKVLKDVFNRFQLSQGKRIKFLPGWDCHGLPIELKVLQKYHQPRDGSTLEPSSIRAAARELASETIEKQKHGFKSWAIMGEWDQPYLTMSRDFEVKQLEVFKSMALKGLIYRQYKPVYWSPSSGTALAEAELEYDDHHVSQAAYVKFRLVKLPPALDSLDATRRTYAVIWTTTPWTLPANRAIAVHPNLDYCVISYQRDYLIVGAAQLHTVAKALNTTDQNYELLLSGIKGKDLVEGARYINGFQGEGAPSLPILTAEYVSSDAGTGLVHTAPGHGHDDYNLCREYNICISAPVNDHGRFTAEAIPENPELLEGKFVLNQGNESVLHLIQKGKLSHSSPLLLQRHEYVHKYPIDWRTKLPVIIRATAQWFANVDNIKGQALQALGPVSFVPESGRSRLESFIRARNQWCISRQRAWGLPLPVLYRDNDEGTQEAIMTPESMSHIIRVISERGTNAWWTDDESDPIWVAPSLPLDKYTRGKDTMDVWFDSGTTWTQLEEKATADEHLADVYLEGSDQHRGWFQSSLLTRIATQAQSTIDDTLKAPFERLITHGFVLDENGQKMSKSLGNVVSPTQIIDATLLPPMKLRGKAKRNAQLSDQSQHDTLGPDALRLWVAKNDYTTDVPIGVQILKGVHTALHKYRVTLKWLLGVLHDYDTRMASQAAQLESELDLSSRLALYHLSRTEGRVHAAYSAWAPYKAMRELERYVNVDLSSFYMETAKDAIYTSNENERLSSLLVCNKILQRLLAMLAPSTPLLVSEVLHYASPSWLSVLEAEAQHPFKNVWQPSTTYNDPGHYDVSLQAQAQCIEAIRHAVSGAQEQSRAAKRIGSGLETSVTVRAKGSASTDLVAAFLRQAIENGELARTLVVSETHFDIDPAHEESLDEAAVEAAVAITPDWDGQVSVSVKRVSAAKCPRCWRFAIKQEQVLVPDYEEGRQICSRCTGVLEEIDKEGLTHPPVS